MNKVQKSCLCARVHQNQDQGRAPELGSETQHSQLFFIQFLEGGEQGIVSEVLDLKKNKNKIILPASHQQQQKCLFVFKEKKGKQTNKPVKRVYKNKKASGRPMELTHT